MRLTYLKKNTFLVIGVLAFHNKLMRWVPLSSKIHRKEEEFGETFKSHAMLPQSSSR